MDASDMRRRKEELRRQAEARRQEQADKECLSRAICRQFTLLPDYAAAPTVMLYVSVRNEVRTDELIEEALAQGKRVVVPYCAGNDLELFRLEGMAELAIGAYGLLEPRLELRDLQGRRIEMGQVDLVMVPGVAFDREGGRLGHGKGYYDRLLRRARDDARLAAVAFECQLFAEVPMADHDLWMDIVLTQTSLYPGRGRKGGDGS